MSPAPNINPEDDLGRTLSHQADRFVERGGSPLELDAVLSRAGEIRRGRRMRASIAMAAVVLAIAVPVGLNVASSPSDEPGGVATQLPTGTPTKTPEKADNNPIALGDLKLGDAPKNGYYLGGKLYYDGKAQPLVGKVPAAVTHMKGGFLIAQDSSGGTGDLTARFVADDGSTNTSSWPTTGSLATSADGMNSALVQPDGTVVYVEAGADRSGEMGKLPGAGPFDVDAVVGENCTGRAEGDGCLVYAHSSGQDRGAWTINAHGVVTAIKGFQKVNAVSTSPELYAGQTSATDSGACSEVRDNAGGGGYKWDTCQYTFDSFSPDGKYLLAYSHSDGAGPTDLVILDATSGDPVLRLQAATDNFVSELTWEDSTHVLASVYDHGRFGVERFGLNGAREYATKTVADTEDSMVTTIKLG